MGGDAALPVLRAEICGEFERERERRAEAGRPVVADLWVCRDVALDQEA